MQSLKLHNISDVATLNEIHITLVLRLCTGLFPSMTDLRLIGSLALFLIFNF